MSLELLSMNSSPTKDSDNNMASSKASKNHKRTLEDLPLETQRGIFKHVSRADLLSLLRVSNHFFSLASAEIYRTLDFNFTASDTLSSGAPTSRIAEAVQAIVASDRDYGQHIKSFRLGIAEDTSHNALLMSRVLWDSVADPSKVLNTLILLVIRKAGMMETFQWDTPIELSGAVYQALHKIQSLHHVRIRLDVPISMKTTVHQGFPPPPQAASIPASSSHLASAYSTPSGSSAFNNNSVGKIKKLQRRRTGTYDYWANGRAFSGFKNLCSLSLIGISNLDCLGEIAACLKASSISLRSLTLSLSNELALRARKPSTTNPTADETSDTDPDPEDEEEIIEASTPNLNSAGQPVNEADIRKEKLAQEAILARIFDLQGVAAEGKRLERSIVRPVPIAGPKYVEGDSQSFAHDLKNMLKTLFNIISGDFEKENYRREALLSMQKVAEKYLSTLPKKTKKPVKDSSKQTNPGSSKISLTPKLPDPTFQEFGHVDGGKSSGDWGASSSSSLPNDWSFHPLNDSWASNSNGMGENSNTGSGKQGTIYPESYMSPYDAGYPITAPKGLPPAHSYSNPAPSIGFWGIPKAPQKSQPKTKLGQAVFDDTELLKSLNQESEAVKLGKLKSAQDKLDFDSENESDNIKKDLAPDKSPLFPAAELTPEDREDSMDIDMEHPDENTIEAGPDQEIIAEVDDKEAAPRKRARFAEAEPISSTSLGSSSAVDKAPTTESRESLLSDGEPLEDKNPDEEMRDYIRATHGLPLEEIALCLIPLKASILARALDLNVLRRLTLLSVGPQEPFWLLLSRLQSYPTHIAFESIHTDHVSIAFLEFLKKFEGLEELFMLDRNNKNDPDAGALKADINITSIRQMALHKHIKTLKRLMIKNENDESWDMDAKTIRFLSIRGAGLLELAISLNMKNYHILMQQLPGFKNLVALQLLSLRSHDRSASLQIECLTFAADSISHLPNQKIKYLALENHMTSIERKPDYVKKYLEMKKERRQGWKGKGKAKMAEPTSLDNSSDSDDLDEMAEITTMETRLRFGVEFWEAREVKIFRKEIRTGKI